MNTLWFNLSLYVVGSACTACGLIKLPAIDPYSEALTAFGAAMLAVARWDRVLPPPAAPVADPK